ncbi:MAG: tetratricopeptide repeat protein [Pseudomonadota bacterium]|nr:tetratricopeptide repeat protein [Pseudomonadota bacterium]
MSVVSFYSFKGGVGRTQAVTNVAAEMAGRGQRVIIVDMDLESPGVHAYFGTADSAARAPGLLDYLDAWRTGEEPPNVDHYLVEVHPGIRVMGPGRLDATYARRIAALSWERFYSEQDGDLVMERLREELLKRADLVLLDSRTGMTDIGTVCTFHLPDVVVALFALHRQGIDGTALVGRALAERLADAQPRLKRVVLVPARVDEADGSLVTEWIGRARTAFAGLPANIGLVEAKDGTTFRVPYDRDVAYGEHIVVATAREGRLAVAYRFLADLLAGEVPSAEDEEAAGWEVEAERLSGTGGFEEALRLARKAVARRRERAVEDPEARVALAASLRRLSSLLSSHGRTREAVQVGQDAVDTYRALVSDDSPAFLEPLARALGDLSVDLSRLGRRAEALLLKEETVSIFSALCESDPPRFLPALAMSVNNLGSGLAQVGRDDESLAQLSKAVALYRSLAGAESARGWLAMALGNLANVLFQVGRQQEALAVGQEAVATYRSLTEEDAKSNRAALALNLGNLSNFLAAEGRREDALNSIEESLTNYRALAADLPDIYLPDVARCQFNLALRLAELGALPAASSAIAECIDAFRYLAAEMPDGYLPELARGLATSSQLHVVQGRPIDALPASTEALTLIRPFHAQLPLAFAEHTRLAVKAYLSACTALDHPPDEALLAGLPRPEPGPGE